MKIFVFLLVLTCLAQPLQAQTLIVNVESDGEPLSLVGIELINLKTGDTITEVADF